MHEDLEEGEIPVTHKSTHSHHHHHHSDHTKHRHRSRERHEDSQPKGSKLSSLSTLPIPPPESTQAPAELPKEEPEIGKSAHQPSNLMKRKRRSWKYSKNKENLKLLVFSPNTKSPPQRYKAIIIRSKTIKLPSMITESIPLIKY